jgi:hypothetical protein
MPKWDERLRTFAVDHKMRNKGALCVALHITRLAKEKGLPLNPDVLVTERGGQVLGLGKGRIQSILADYGIKAVLAEEGGRTSRGSLGNMRDYVPFLNKSVAGGAIELSAIESWWVAQVQAYFKSKPFSLKFDAKSSLRVVIRDLLKQAEVKQKDGGGTMYHGAMLQHLVGAKLELVLGKEIEHNGSCVADAVSDRIGDFFIEDVVIHVTVSPGEALMRKCRDNIEHGYRPLVITTHKGAAAADVLGENQGIAGRVDIFEAEQFLAGNVFELAKFAPDKRRERAVELVEHYNRIVDGCESDPSLRICVK